VSKVWRFPLKPVEAEAPDEGEQVQAQVCEMEMPVGAEILTLQFSTQGLTLYALVDPDAETETRSFFVCGNGVDLPDGVGAATYRGTFKVPGSLTAHVFEVAQVAV
jgi:hypothetical protein